MADPRNWIGLVTLTVLQIVLGMDNIVLLTILSGQLPRDERSRARKLGLIAAMTSRLILLGALIWLASLLTGPLFRVGDTAFSGKSLILIAGGLFLIYKATVDIHSKLEGAESGANVRPAATLKLVLIQIFMLDVVFSFDTVFTALGMSRVAAIQILSVVLATGLMMFGVGPLARLIDRHPTLKVLALSFLVLIGLNLVAEGLGFDIPSGYVYFAMGWSVFVELLNIRERRRRAATGKEPDTAVEPGE